MGVQPRIYPFRSFLLCQCMCASQKTLNLQLHCLNLGGHGAVLSLKNRQGHDVSRNLRCPAQSRFRWHENVRNVFILAKQWKVQQNLDGICISSEDNQVCDTAVQCLGSLIRAFLYHLRVAGLLHKIEDRLAEAVLCQRKCLFADFTCHFL